MDVDAAYYYMVEHSWQHFYADLEGMEMIGVALEWVELIGVERS